ncbi:MAG: DUF3905 domain-containing protein [Firmicutes bacterium]|nr:DUF3905 domain-containing protein [Bacillota bacterium]
MPETNSPWRKTPLDRWSADVDPAIMASDRWVAPGDIGARKAELPDGEEDITKRAMLGRFMHPQHDASWDGGSAAQKQSDADGDAPVDARASRLR